MKRLVDACHREGVVVALDVVYDHLGPEGNCLADYGPYFTGRYRTPWGKCGWARERRAPPNWPADAPQSA